MLTPWVCFPLPPGDDAVEEAVAQTAAQARRQSVQESFGVAESYIDSNRFHTLVESRASAEEAELSARLQALRDRL